MSARLIGTARGNGFAPHTASGTALGLFDALDRRYGLDERVDVGLRPAQRAVAALAAVHPVRDRWRQRFWLSPLGFRFLSANSRRLLEGAPRETLAVQVYGMFHTTGVPFVMYIDTTQAMARREWPEWSPYSGAGGRLWLSQEREAYAGAQHVFTASRAAARSLQDDYGLPAERVTVVGAGSNFFPLPPARLRPRRPEILFIGREWERKGGPELLQAFRAVRREVPDARLVVVGTDRVAPEPGVEVRGKLMDRSELAACFESASVYCVPSRFCPFTNSLMEAMAYSLPCVSTTSAGTPDLVADGETGILVEPRDAGAIAGALLRLLREPELADRMGRAGRQRVERELTWDRVAERMAPVLEGLGAVRAASEAAHQELHAGAA
jgi:glycosyltransferase involved in cell wall biosynthesis